MSLFKSERAQIHIDADGDKTPHYFSAPDGKPLALAGLWESFTDPETRALNDSATIIVGAANEWMRRFHDRMPVILDWRNIGAWLAGDDAGALLKPPPDDSLQEWIVSPRVNRSGVGDDDAGLIESRGGLSD